MNSSLNQWVGRAVAIAATAHQTQVDKANAPYILHPLRLMLRGQTPLEQIVAVLHDVVEDSDWTLEQLSAEGFPTGVIAALDCLTRRSDEGYNEFIDRVLTNPLATRVKRYDLEDNMTLTRMTTLTTKDVERLQRYHAVYQRLLKAIGSEGT